MSAREIRYVLRNDQRRMGDDEVTIKSSLAQILCSLFGVDYLFALMNEIKLCIT